MEGQAILALMAVLCLGMVTGALIAAGISGLVVRHAVPPPPVPSSTGGVSPDALAAVVAKFHNVVPLIEQLNSAVAALNKTTTAGK